MSKKILKRSLALGALMAFVITGSVWAGEVNNTVLPSINESNFNGFWSVEGLDGLEADDKSWTAFFPDNDDKELAISDKLVTNGTITYSGGPLGLYAAYRLDNDKDNRKQRLDNPNDNILEIKHNLTNKTGSIYLYGAAVMYGDSDNASSAERNSVYIGVDNEQIKIESNDHIFIGGALSNDSLNFRNVGHNVKDNKTIINNVNFILPVDKSVCVSGGETRGGDAAYNTIVIKNSAIENAQILGGFVSYVNMDGVSVSDYVGGYALSNTVTLDNVIFGENSICAGGYINAVSGDADGNTVNIEGNSQIAGTVYGGYADDGTASGNTINIKDTADVSKANLFGDNDGKGTDNTLNVAKGWQGAIGSVQNFDVINIEKDAEVTLDKGLNCSAGTVSIKGGTLELRAASKIGTLEAKSKGKVAFGANGHLDVDNVQGNLIVTEAGKTSDELNTVEALNEVANKLGVKETNSNAEVVIAESSVRGAVVGDIEFETIGSDNYYHGTVKEVKEKVNTKNKAIGEAGVALKLHWRAHMNDMNKRLGELRDANGECGVWTRMVRGESEYENTKAQYNQYQLGYDEKLSVDERWTVGAAVTFAEGDASYANGSTDDKSTAFAIYGSKLNNDGTFVDLIARYTHLESDLEDVYSGKGDYSTNGMSVSAEFGKRIQQGKGLWVEPQVELTYGTFDSAELKLNDKTAHVGDMDSFIGRVGFRIGKDLEQGNVYARASYLYDFDGETENTFSDGNLTRTIKEDLGGGWWEVGVGTNINLSKATYIYADVEKTFGGEVDTNWQWNLGVRYSF